MAKSAKSKFSSILVWGLLAVLLVGLAGFGVTGFGGQVRSIGSVGETVIDANTYANSLNQQINAISEQTGQQITFEQAEQFGISQTVLQQRIAMAAIEEAAREAGLSVGDSQVAQRIQSVPAFQGPDGTFDREAYTFLLERSGQTVATFEDSIRREAASALLQRSILSGLTPPATYGEAVYRYYAESRAITFAEIPEDLLDTPPAAPTEEEARAYYEANPDQFTAPESKQITYALLSPETLIDEVSVSETDLRTAYDERTNIYNRPERRMVDRLGFADMAAAEAARAALDAGDTTFEALLSERGLSAADAELGAINRGDLNAPAAEAVFALNDTGIAGPVESAIGPALFRVNAILSAQTTSFEDALPELRAELAQSGAQALVEDEVETLDDLLAGGATLEQLVDESPMTLGTLTWSADQIPEELPATLTEFQTAVAVLSPDDFPEVILSDEGHVFALRLDELTPAAVIPFEEVRDEAMAGAAAETSRLARSELGETFRDALENGDAPDSLGLTLQTSTGLTRQRIAPDVPVPVLSTAYEMGAGESRVVDGDGIVYLVRVDTITPPDSSTPEARQILQRVSQETAQAVADDILSQLAQAIASEAGIHLNQTALSAVHAAMR